MKDLVMATSGSGVLVVEAFQIISGASGEGIDALKIVLVFVIVVTSTIGTLAKDRDGDGVPDIYKDIQRLFTVKPKPRKKRRKRTEGDE